MSNKIFFSILDCYKDDIHFEGSGQSLSVINVESCMIRCKKISNCKSWSYNKETKSCLILTSVTAVDYDPKRISGPRNCVSMNEVPIPQVTGTMLLYY